MCPNWSKQPVLAKLITDLQRLASPPVPVKSAGNFFREGVCDAISEAVEGVVVAGLGGEVKIGVVHHLKAVHLHCVNCHCVKRKLRVGRKIKELRIMDEHKRSKIWIQRDK